MAFVRPALTCSIPTMFIPYDSHFFREVQRYQANLLHEVFPLPLSFFNEWRGRLSAPLLACLASLLKLWRSKDISLFEFPWQESSSCHIPSRRAAVMEGGPQLCCFWNLSPFHFGLWGMWALICVFRKCLSGACVLTQRCMMKYSSGWLSLTIGNRPLPHTGN